MFLLAGLPLFLFIDLKHPATTPNFHHPAAVMASQGRLATTPQAQHDASTDFTLLVGQPGASLSFKTSKHSLTQLSEVLHQKLSGEWRDQDTGSLLDDDPGAFRLCSR